MNNTSKRKLFVLIGIFAVIILQVVAVFAALAKYTPSNVIFYVLVVYLSMRNLFSQKPHHIAAAMWTICTAYLLGWFFGIIEVVVYWALYFIKVKNNPAASASTGSGRTRTVQATVIQTSGTITNFGRIPFLRIPMPWLKYTLDLDNGLLTRDNFFPEKPDKEDSKRDFLGKDDDLLLSQVFDWSFSTRLYRTLAGTSCFEFQSKKIGKSGDKKNHWHCLPASMTESLRFKLIELNK